MAGVYPEFTSESVKRMLAFLPGFERGDFKDAEQQYKESGQNPEIVDRLLAETYKSGFVVVFDWVKWPSRAEVDTATEIARADLLTLRKLLTAYVRADRFSGGTLSGLCSGGKVEMVLRRLKVLHEEGPANSEAG